MPMSKTTFYIILSLSILSLIFYGVLYFLSNFCFGDGGCPATSTTSSAIMYFWSGIGLLFLDLIFYYIFQKKPSLLDKRDLPPTPTHSKKNLSTKTLFILTFVFWFVALILIIVGYGAAFSLSSQASSPPQELSFVLIIIALVLGLGGFFTLLMAVVSMFSKQKNSP
jgi:hypothetical protein